MAIIKTPIVDAAGKIVDASLPDRLLDPQLSATYATPSGVSGQISSASAPLGLRTNLDTNPSFETGVTGLTANGAGNTVAVSTAQAYVGTQSALITWGTAYGNVAKSLTTVAGLTYTWSQYVYVPAGATAVQLTAYGSVPAQVYSAASTVTGSSRFPGNGLLR